MINHAGTTVGEHVQQHLRLGVIIEFFADDVDCWFDVFERGIGIPVTGKRRLNQQDGGAGIDGLVLGYVFGDVHVMRVHPSRQKDQLGSWGISRGLWRAKEAHKT